MFILELITSGTATRLAGYLMDKVVEYSKNKGTDKEIESLKNQLDIYKEKAQFVEKELMQFKEIALKLENKLGNNYISENAFVNWNLEKIKPETKAFEIKIWTEKGNFQKGTRDISVIPKKGNYKIGDKINLYFQSERDCYLTLINYGTSGKMTILLPNAFSQKNFIKEGITYAIPGDDYPFDYVLSSPGGTEKIKAIGTTRYINLLEMKFNTDEVFKTSSSASRDISVVAKKVESAEPGEWAEALCEFEVA